MALNLASVSGAPIDGPADCTLACDEGHLTAHKIVLCDHSRYLHDILSKFPNAEHPIIILTELNITDIKILVHYMYSGELVISNDGSPTSLLRAAQILKIDSLTDFDDDDEEEKADDIVLPLVNGTGRTTGEARQQHTNNNNNNNNNTTNYKDSNRNQNIQQHAKMDHDDDDEDIMDDEDEDENEENLSIGTGADVDHLHLHHSHNHHLHHHARAEANNNNASNNKIRCHLCNIGLSDVKCLYRHVLTRHLPEKWGYKCEFCDREFSRDDHLMRHYTTKHKNMEFNREKIRETRRLNREMAKNFHDQISTIL